MSQERRRFFRITDLVGIAYRVLSADEAAKRGGSKGDTTAERDLAGFTRLLREISNGQPAVAKALSHLNHKIDRVIQQLELETQRVGQLAHRVQEVNISACGIAFHVNDDLRVGQVISLDIVLYPSDQQMHTLATIVGVEPSSEGQGNYVRADFQGINYDDQEALIQHILQRQSSLIRQMHSIKGEDD